MKTLKISSKKSWSFTKIVLAFAALLTINANIAVWGQTCDYFTAPNSTTVTGWTEQVGDWAIFNNSLQSPASASYSYITYNGSSQANGCITGRATYGSGAMVKLLGLVGRYSSPSSNIYIKLQDNSSVGYWDSWFIYDGNSLITSGTGLNFGTDANIQMEYSGTSVTFRIDTDRNGTWDYTYTATVTTTAAGLCGVVAYNQCYMDDWCYGASCVCITPGTPASLGVSNILPTSITLNWAAGSPAGSPTVTYYWNLYASDGTSITSGSTIGTSVLVSGLVAGRGCYFTVYAYTNCNGTSSATATSGFFSTSSSMIGYNYCTPVLWPNNSCNYLNSVTTSGANTNITTAVDAGYGNYGYTYYSSPVISEDQGGSFTLTVQAQGSCGIAYYHVFADWNHDGDFSDVGEWLINNAGVNSGNSVTNFTINVPATATLGNTPMRILCMGNGSAPSSACPDIHGNYSEAEDYLINVTSACLTPTNPTASGTTTITCGNSTNISATSTNATTIYWYTGSCGGTLIGTSSPGANFSVSPTTTTTYYARGYNSSGACWSAGCGSVTITVNPASAVCSATPSTICTGSSSNLNATVSGATSYSWSPSAGLSNPNIINPIASPTTTTTYTLTATGGASVPDQSQLINNTNMATFGQTCLAQSFTPSASSICGASINLYNVGSGTGDITIQLYTNLPTSGGILLTQGTVTGISPGQWAQVSWASVSVTPGITYYLVFTSTNSGLGIAGSSSNTYPGGQVYANSGYGSFPSYDYTFETYTCNVCTSVGQVTVTVSQLPTTANAGPDQVGASTCGLTTVTLAANTPTEGTGAWSIISGVGGTVTTPSSPTSTFTGTSGTTYVLRWTISNNPCTASTDDVTITFTANPATPIVGTITQPTCTLATGSVDLSGLPAGSWTINPGGITGSGTTTTISGLAAGTYNFTVNDGVCTSAATVNVVINPQPATPATPVVGTITQPTCTLATGSVDLSGLPAGSWTINPGGITGSGTTTTISGLAAGTYNFTVNDGVCTSAATVNVVINPQPATPATPVVGTITQPTCTLATGSVDLSGLPAGSWTINPGSITGSGTTTTISGLAAGTYNFTVNDGVCTSAATVNVVINPQPATPSAPVVSVVDSCGKSILTATGYTGNLLWSTLETTPVINVTTAGIYSVTQEVGGCISIAGTGTAAPKTIPNAPVVTVVDSCGESTLTATGYTGTLLWNTLETTPEITVTSAGTYSVTQEVGGCTSAAGTGTAAPSTIPSAPIITVVDSCGKSTLTATGYTGNLLWSTMETTSSITVNVEGLYSVTQTVGGCTSSSASATTAPKPIPFVSLGQDTIICANQVIVLDAENAGSTYLWTPGGQITQTITVDSLGFGLGAHSFSVLVTAPNSCSAKDTVVVTFDPCAGVADNNDNIFVSIIPNPSNGLFYLTVKNSDETTTLNIFNMNGQLVYSEIITSAGIINKSIDLKSYPRGMYLLRLVSNNVNHIEKIIVE